MNKPRPERRSCTFPWLIPAPEDDVGLAPVPVDADVEDEDEEGEVVVVLPLFN
jgi:hypothetical protein